MQTQASVGLILGADPVDRRGKTIRLAGGIALKTACHTAAPFNVVATLPRDFLEICHDRYQRRSLMLTSQMPVAHWHKQIGAIPLSRTASFGGRDCGSSSPGLRRFLRMVISVF
jgi:hypothetical protein